jgi:hypothetical protein
LASAMGHNKWDVCVCVCVSLSLSLSLTTTERARTPSSQAAIHKQSQEQGAAHRHSTMGVRLLSSLLASSMDHQLK